MSTSRSAMRPCPGAWKESQARADASEFREKISRAQEVFVQPGFGCSRFGSPVVVPADQRRHGHQDRCGAPARLQAEQRAAVVNQVEFHISAATVELKVALPLAPGHPPAALQNGHVGGKKMIADASREAEGMVEALVGVVVEEQTADAACFVTMRQEEIAVAPGLVFLVHAGPEGLAGRPGGAMPEQDVFVDPPVRREIEAAAEPPPAGPGAGLGAVNASEGVAFPGTPAVARGHRTQCRPVLHDPRSQLFFATGPPASRAAVLAAAPGPAGACSVSAPSGTSA